MKCLLLVMELEEKWIVIQELKWFSICNYIIDLSVDTGVQYRTESWNLHDDWVGSWVNIIVGTILSIFEKCPKCWCSVYKTNMVVRNKQDPIQGCLENQYVKTFDSLKEV